MDANATDQELLHRYTQHQEEHAFGAIVKRYGPAVWRVCRNSVRDEDLAQDVFQATFLVLAKQADKVSWRSSIANWLYETARRTAKDANKRRRVTTNLAEGVLENQPTTQTEAKQDQAELMKFLFEELDKLSPKLRAPLLLCYLEGNTRDQASQQLNLSMGTLKRRLKQAKDVLQQRLTSKGYALSFAVLASLSTQIRSASVPSGLIPSTKSASLAFAVNETSSVKISLTSIELAKGHLRTMLLRRLSIVFLVAVFIISGGIGIMTLVNASSDKVNAKKPLPKKINQPVEDETKIDPKLKALFQKSGWIFTATYRSKKGYDPGGNPQTLYSFTDCQHFKKKMNFGPIKSNKALTTIGIYNTAPQFEQLKPGTKVLVFLPMEYGKVNEVLPTTKDVEKQLQYWVNYGAYSKDERQAFAKKAGWIVVVDKPQETCLESFPCQHSWMFPVLKTLKGNNVPNKLRISGRYRSHNNIPDSLKTFSKNGKLILFMKANAKNDTDVIAGIPWSAEMEKELE